MKFSRQKDLSEETEAILNTLQARMVEILNLLTDNYTEESLQIKRIIVSALYSDMRDENVKALMPFLSQELENLNSIPEEILVDPHTKDLILSLAAKILKFFTEVAENYGDSSTFTPENFEIMNLFRANYFTKIIEF